MSHMNTDYTHLCDYVFGDKGNTLVFVLADRCNI